MICVSVLADDAANGVSRRVRRGRGDGDLRTDELIDQSRFPDVGATENGDEAGPGHRTITGSTSTSSIRRPSIRVTVKR
jgi:hypothetical protein